LPETAECDKLVSFLTDDGKLIIEIPLKETKVQPKSDLFPRITDTETSGKQVSMNFNVPESITPEKIQVNVKDRCLIIKAEDDEKLPEGESKLFYFKQILLPENTDFNALKCYFDNHQISITAPLNIEYKPIRSVPIEYKPQQQLISDKKQSHQKSVEKE
jgi:HSP20 family molecular chaperone IbpA